MQGSFRGRLLAGCAFAAAALTPAMALAQLAPGAPSQVSSGGLAPIVGQAGQTTDITLGASRTIMNWSSYNLASDQTVVYRFQDRNWIVLNRVAGAANIDGQIEAFVGAERGAGNVWFQAPGGVMFGPNARVNVGGLLATPAAVSDGFLTSGGASFDFTGGGAGQVAVRSGAQITAGGGAVVLVAGHVVTEDGATINGPATSTVLYGAASDFTVRFGQTQAGDLDLLDFVVPTGGGTASTAPLTLGGQTTAGNVTLAVVNRAEVASAVISAPGFIAAQSASADNGDVVLSAGVNIVNGQPGVDRVNTTTATTATFGVVTAQRDLLGAFAAPTTLVASQLASGRDLGFAVASLEANAVNAGRNLAISADRGITLRGDASAGSAAIFRTSGALNVNGGAGAINAIGRLQLDVGTVQAAKLNSGRSIVVNASGAGAASAPAVNLGAVLADDDITITSTNAAGGIFLGSATIAGTRADEAPAGRNLKLTASGANADVTYGPAAGSPITGATNVVLTAGRDVTANVKGLLSLGGGGAGRTFTIRANDLDITGKLTTADLRIESLGGGVVLGGTPGVSAPGRAAADGDDSLKITNAEFQNLFVTGQFSLYAGTTGGPYGDINILDLSIDPSRLPKILLGAGANNLVSVTGVFAPTVTGGILTIGDPLATSGFQPGRILISGSIGVSTGSATTGFTGVRGFDTVALNAINDVILGSARFIALVTTTDPAQIDLAKGLPFGVAPTPDELNKIYLTAGILSLAAPLKIVQQNTGTLSEANGFFLTNRAVNPIETLLLVTPAQVVDLYGTLRDINGVLRNGAAAVRGNAIRVVSGGRGGFGGNIHLNGFDVGQASATGPAAVAAAAQQGAQVVATVGAAAAADPAETSAATVAAALSAPPPQVIAIAPPPLDAVAFESIDVGAGSEEIWRRRKK